MRIRIKEEVLDSKSKEVLDDLKSQISALMGTIEDELEDASKEQKEGILTTASIALALPAILGAIARFGKTATSIIRRVLGQKPTNQGDLEKYFQQMGRVADELHHLYMKPLELVIRRFIKDKDDATPEEKAENEIKRKKISSFIFHVIVGIMLLAAGVTAVKAIQSNNISLATLETALTAIKGGEIKNYITKLIA